VTGDGWSDGVDCGRCWFYLRVQGQHGKLEDLMRAWERSYRRARWWSRIAERIDGADV
jgi:hypothetical protein